MDFELVPHVEDVAFLEALARAAVPCVIAASVAELRGAGAPRITLRIAAGTGARFGFAAHRSTSERNAAGGAP